MENRQSRAPSSGVPGFSLRFARRADCGLIMAFIRELAAYEKLEDQVTGGVALLEKTLFDQGRAEVILGDFEGEPAAFALFFHNYSTFLTRPGLYLEDLFVRPAFRGRGLGREMLSCLARLAIERECGRLEWYCLDWNAPSIAFYKAQGAQPLSDWTTYRVDGERLRALAGWR